MRLRSNRTSVRFLVSIAIVIVILILIVIERRNTPASKGRFHWLEPSLPFRRAGSLCDPLMIFQTRSELQMHKRNEAGRPPGLVDFQDTLSGYGLTTR